ncbi:MAG: ribonuclease III domain-containing protein [Candidatus Hermodarchaeota archaeon]
MSRIDEQKLGQFQKFIDYRFKDINLLKQSLTTPKLGNELGVPHYEVLETLGDAVIKLIFSLKLYRKGKNDPGELTKMKQCLENNQTFSTIALKMDLNNYIFTSKKQQILGTKTLADALEAVCGALYLDSNISIVEKKIINRFFEDWDQIIKDSSIFNKNQLLEYLQRKYRITPIVKCEFINKGSDHNPKWIAIKPNIFNKENELLVELPKDLKSKAYKSQVQSEQDIYEKILRYLKKVKE